MVQSVKSYYHRRSAGPRDIKPPTSAPEQTPVLSTAPSLHLREGTGGGGGAPHCSSERGRSHGGRGGVNRRNMEAVWSTGSG